MRDNRRARAFQHTHTHTHRPRLISHGASCNLRRIPLTGHTFSPLNLLLSLSFTFTLSLSHRPPPLPAPSSSSFCVASLHHHHHHHPLCIKCASSSVSVSSSRSTKRCCWSRRRRRRHCSFLRRGPVSAAGAAGLVNLVQYDPIHSPAACYPAAAFVPFLRRVSSALEKTRIASGCAAPSSF